MKRNYTKLAVTLFASTLGLVACGKTPDQPGPVQPVEADPVITLSSTADLTVNAGEELTLPTFTAKDYDNTDLTSAVEIEDDFETGTITGGKFTSKVAGVHNISYYVMSTKTERETEVKLKITVVPASPEVDLGESNQMSNLADFGSYTESFAKGYGCDLHVGDGNDATEISGTSDAIDGNSLIIDSSRTRGNAAYSVFLVGCDQYMKKGRKATYKLEFDYKVIEVDSSNPGNIYCGLRCDTDNGDNYQFMASGSEIGVKYHSTRTFTSKYYGEDATNVGFFFFDMNSSGKVRFAIDNFKISIEDCPQFVNKVPTVTELKEGFTWDWSNDACADMTSGLQTKVADIEDQEIKSALSADEGFGEYVMHITPNGGTNFGGLDATNLLNNYIDNEQKTHKFKLVVDFKYYAVVDFPHLLPMNNGVQNGNPIQGKSGEGAIKSMHFEKELINVNSFRFYDGNAQMDFYLGNFTAKLVEEVEEPSATPKTVLGYKLGETTVNKGPAIDAGNKGTSWADAPQAEKDKVSACSEMAGLEPTRINPNADGNAGDHESQRTLVYPTSGLEANNTYLVCYKYFVASSVDAAGRKVYMYLACPEGQIFEPIDDIDLTEGYHEYYHEVTMDSKNWAGAGINLYINDESASIHFSYVLYFKSVTATLVKIDGFKDVASDGENKVGLVKQRATSQFGKSTAWDNNETVAADAHFAGKTPEYVEMKSDNDKVIEWFNGSNLQKDYTYRVRLTVYITKAEVSKGLMINLDNRDFITVVEAADLTVGYHDYYFDITPSGATNFFSFYMNNGPFELKFYVGDLAVYLPSVPVAADPEPETILGKKLGDVTLDKGPAIDAGNKGTSWADAPQDEKDKVSACSEMAGLEPTRINPNAAGNADDNASQRTLVYPTTALEGGCKYLVTLEYYIAASTDAEGREVDLYIPSPAAQHWENISDIDMSVGYHEYSKVIEMEDVDWTNCGINLYIIDKTASRPFSYAIYFKTVKATLVGIKGFTETYKTAAGKALGDVAYETGCQHDGVYNPWGNMAAWDNNAAVAADPHFVGLEPSKVAFPCDGGDDTSAVNSFKYDKLEGLEASCTYRVKMAYYMAEAAGEASYFFQFNGANANIVKDVSIDRSIGYHEAYVTIEVPAGFSGKLNVNIGANCSASTGMADTMYIKNIQFIVTGGCVVTK